MNGRVLEGIVVAGGTEGNGRYFSNLIYEENHFSFKRNRIYYFPI